jgi:single-strand DNA-binding protein
MVLRVNKAILIGNLTADPEVRTTPSGVLCAMFTLAINRRYKDANGNKAADFIRIVAWRQLAELCDKYLKKGRKVAVVGQIQSRSYDGQDGSKRYVTEIIADEIEFLSSGSAGQGVPMPPEPEYGQAGFTEVDDDELPF